jgi:hypothetical protein
MAAERVSRGEVLLMRRELFAEIPDKIRIRLADMDHLLGWPPVEGNVEADRLRAAIGTYVEHLEINGGLTSAVSANFHYLLRGDSNV